MVNLRSTYRLLASASRNQHTADTLKKAITAPPAAFRGVLPTSPGQQATFSVDWLLLDNLSEPRPSHHNLSQEQWCSLGRPELPKDFR
jgi:hypothetical protein